MRLSARLALALLAASVGLPAVAAAVDKCGKVEVSGRPAGNHGKAAEVTLAATEVEDVVFTLKMASGPVGDHVVTLQVYLPEGGLYQTLSVPVTFGTKAKGAPQRRVDGYPFPVDAVQAKPITSGPDAGKQLVTITMPLAGTVIVSNSLYGLWGVDLYLDDEPEACAEREPFRITP
jgi:hypothetical protein